MAASGCWKLPPRRWHRLNARDAAYAAAWTARRTHVRAYSTARNNISTAVSSKRYTAASVERSMRWADRSRTRSTSYRAQSGVPREAGNGIRLRRRGTAAVDAPTCHAVRMRRGCSTVKPRRYPPRRRTHSSPAPASQPTEQHYVASATTLYACARSGTNTAMLRSARMLRHVRTMLAV